MARVFYFLVCLRFLQGAASDVAFCSNDSTAEQIAPGESLGHRVAIVTGGDSGLGYEIARVLAKQGASVVIASHNLEKCRQAAQNITKEVGGVVEGMSLDLSSFQSVRNFTVQFLKNYDVLNYLINNAGMSGVDSHGHGHSSLTADGFEEVFQVNYLGHFLLTELLLPILRKNHGWSPSRIVSTASYEEVRACQMLNASDDCFKDWTYFPPPLGKHWFVNGTEHHTTNYGISKFALIEHAAELSIREAENSIKAFSTGPGLVATKMNAYMNFTQACIDYKWGEVQQPCPYTEKQGAAVIAVGAFTATQAGGWYTRYNKCSTALPVATHGFKTAMQSELYDKSLQWVGLKTSTVDLMV